MILDATGAIDAVVAPRSGQPDPGGAWVAGVDSTAVLDAMQHSVALVDTSGVIQFVNLGWRRFGSESRHDPACANADVGLGSNYLEVCAAAAARAVEGAASAHQGLLAVLQGRLPLFRRDYPCHSITALRWFRMSVMPVGTPVQGALVMHHEITEQCAHCVYGVVQDVSARRKLEMRLKRRRDQIDALAGREIASQTVAVIAHALNQPLAALSAYSAAALRMLRSDAMSHETLDHALLGIVTQSDRAGQVLHRLQDFLHADEVPTGPTPLHELLTETLWLASDGGHAAFNLALEVEEGEQQVLVDPTRLQAIVLNLLRNALESMRLAGMSDGDMRVVVRAREADGKMHITISDIGPGLAPETADRIFDPFFSTKDGSIGLGLSISRALIEAQGGKLWLEAGSADGTTFQLTLRLAR